MKPLYASSILAAFMLACVPPSSGGGGNRNDDASNRPTQDADLSGTDGATDEDATMREVGDAGPLVCPPRERPERTIGVPPGVRSTPGVHQGQGHSAPSVSSIVPKSLHSSHA